MLPPSLNEYFHYVLLDFIPNRLSHLPNIRAFAIFPILALQSSLLLIPQDGKTRLARKSIIPLGLYYAFTVLEYDFTPRNKWIAFNFIKNLAFPIGVAKTLEYGFVRQQYHWIGYDSAYNLNDKSSNASKPKSKSEKNEVNNFNAESTNKGAFQKIQVVSTSTSTNLFSLQTMKNAISLNLSHRGHGWNWGIKGPLIPKPFPQSTFLWSAFIQHIRSHILLVTCISLIQYSGFPVRNSSFLHGLFRYLDISNVSEKLSFPGNEILSQALVAIVFGTAVWNFLDLLYLEVAIGAYALTKLGRKILPGSISPPPFDSRTWPPLLQSLIWSTSLADWWTYRWHSVLRREFVIMGFKPARYLTRGLGRDVSALFGVLGAFAASGALHDIAIYTASWEKPFDLKLASMQFFMIQGLGLVAEQIFTRLTGKQVGGFLGRLWILLVIGFPGATVTRAWLSRGLLNAQPTPDDWEWWRWAIPAFMYLPRLQDGR